MFGFIIGAASGIGATLAVQEWGMPSAGWIVAGIAVTCLVCVLIAVTDAAEGMFR